MPHLASVCSYVPCPALEKEGFKVNPDEWWSFDYPDWRLYRVLDLPFAEIHPSPRAPDAGRL